MTIEKAEAAPDEAAADEEAARGFIASIGSSGPTPYKGYDWKAHVPSRLLRGAAPGPLFGLVRPETESVYVVDAPPYRRPDRLVGELSGPPAPGGAGHGEGPGGAEGRPYWLVGELSGADGGAPAFFVEERRGGAAARHPARVLPYDETVDLFSRNAGILESGALLSKTAVVIGCGSVGSLVAMELARSGVGRLVLIDADALEVHNVCRHQCGFDDLGRYKVDAVRDKVLNINPGARVEAFRARAQDVPREQLAPYLGRDTLVVGAGDNRASAELGCELACETDSSFVATCCWNRAFAGEVFYWESGRGLACYRCALGGLVDDARPASHGRYFASEADESRAPFEPGIAADIDFVTLVAVKACIDLLMRDEPGYEPRVLGHLRQYTWVCNTNSERAGGGRAAMFSHPLQVTASLRVGRDPACPWCGERARAATGAPSRAGRATPRACPRPRSRPRS